MDLPAKLPEEGLAVINNLLLKFICKCQGPKIVKTTLKK
jgi:hypothetical protein